jgi:hypothetical protein
MAVPMCSLLRTGYISQGDHGSRRKGPYLKRRTMGLWGKGRYPKLKRNAVRCLGCGDVIESKTVHEWVKGSCGVVGVDGGLLYRRRADLKATWKSEFEDENTGPENYL